MIFILDVFIQNPLQFSTTPRIFFSRGANKKETPSGDTLLGVLSNYNIVAALLPDTNDLIVSVLNKDNNMENIIVPNVSVQQSFRLTMVVMEQALEVYINGKLIKTRTFSASPKDVKDDINAATGIESNAIKVHNLKIWPRILTVKILERDQWQHQQVVQILILIIQLMVFLIDIRNCLSNKCI